jgi:uncharacterized protein (DUF924 family)
MTGPEDVLSFWLDEVGPSGWYKGSEELDADIRERFESLWEGACEGRHSLWLTHPSGALAYIILMDQLSRNMFRGTAKAFVSDRAALTAAKSAIDKGWDLKIDAPARVFFYMPLEHSENLYDQDRCIRLMHERLPDGGGTYKLHAQAHRSVIRQFGRFPGRNEALGRASTPAELAFMTNGGYGALVRQLEQETVAA